MKKFNLIPILSLPILFIACTKTTHPAPTPTYSVTAAIDGVPTSFSSIVTVDSSSTPGTVYIVAHSDSANLTPLLEITLTGNHSLPAGIYSSLADSTGRQGLLGYTGWNGDMDNQYTSITDTVTLTTSNNTGLAGTFQGSCAYTLDSTVTITNGKFTVGWGGQ